MANKSVSLKELDFGALLRPGDHVLWSQGSSEPIPLLRRLIAQRGRLRGIVLFLTVSFSNVLLEDNTTVFGLRGLGGLGSYRNIAKNQYVDVVPVHLSQLPRLISDGDIPVDVYLVQLTHAEDGFNLGLDCGFALAAMRRARLVIAEVNSRMPSVYGQTKVDPELVDIWIETDRPLIEVPTTNGSEEESRIAQNAIPFVPQHATIQLGIGSIPDQIARALSGHADLGIHSGMLGDGLIGLIRTGAATNKYKTVDAGLTVGGAVFGGQHSFEFVRENSSVALRSFDYTHSITTLSRIDRFTAINSAVEVDLTGQVNGEAIPSRYIGAIGGLADFTRGARLSKGGCSLVVLPSVTPRGVSRIVTRAQSGITTVGRADIDVVVTEHGAAELRGRSIRERIHAMIDVADPAFRDDLRQAATSIL